MVAVVLMGAGASSGSGPTEPRKLPLGSGKGGLFDHLLAYGGLVTTLPLDVQELFRANFEEGMEKYEETVDGDINAFHRYLAHYLLQFKPLDGNEYLNLIRSLGYQRVVYSTLNYDVMFEWAAAMFGFPFPKYGIGDSGAGPTLLKLHGSANFWPDLNVDMKGCSFHDVGVYVDSGIRALNPNDALRECVEQDSLSPAMCMYAVGKRNRICKTFVDRIVQQWTDLVGKASYVFISGVAVNLADDHIWAPLGKTQAKVFYYGFDADATRFEDWKMAFSKRDAFFRRASFKQAIPLMRRALFP